MHFEVSIAKLESLLRRFLRPSSRCIFNRKVYLEIKSQFFFSEEKVYRVIFFPYVIIFLRS